MSKWLAWGRCMHSLLFLGQRQHQEFRHFICLFRFLKKMLGRGPAILHSTNKYFCWWMHDFKSYFSNQKQAVENALREWSGGDGQSSVAVTIHPQHNLTVSYLDSGNLDNPLSTPVYQTHLSNPQTLTWGRGRRPGESCWSNNLCRDSREGRVRMTSLGAGDKVKVKD